MIIAESPPRFSYISVIARISIASSRTYSLISNVLFLTLCAFIKTIHVTAGGTTVAGPTGGGGTADFAAVIADGDAPTGSATWLTVPVLFARQQWKYNNLGNRRNRVC